MIFFLARPAASGYHGSMVIRENEQPGDGPEIVIIAAVAANGVIGRDNDIPWRIPGEQRRFREITMGYPLIMGRLTYESIGHPLAGRRNIVISRTPGFQPRGVEVVPSLAEGVARCRSSGRVFVIGGEGVFREALQYADTLILSELDLAVEGDVFFPAFSRSEFSPVSRERCQGPPPYTVVTYRRFRPRIGMGSWWEKLSFS